MMLKVAVLSAQPQLPEGFNIEWHSRDWTAPVDIDFDQHNKMYVAEKEGSIWIVKEGRKLEAPLVDISEEVANFGDNGLLSFALDRNFYDNGYFYLYYVVDRYHWMFSHQSDYDPMVSQYWSATFARVTRYQADPATDFETMIPDSRYILIGKTNEDGIPSLYTSHMGGTVDMGDDGSLLVSTGDGSTWKKPYGGNGPPFNEEYVEQALKDGVIRPDEELGAFRAQYRHNYNGKILRIDPMTGLGMPGNPYYTVDNATSHEAKIYALGLRNGFRLKVREGSGSTDPSVGRPGVIYVMDVGNENWEELNVVKVPGQNFGWPLYEGVDPMTTFQQMTTRHPAYISEDEGCEESDGYLFKDLIQQPKTIFPFNEFSDPCSTDQSLSQDFTYIHSLPAIAFGHWAVQGNFYVPLYDHEGLPYMIRIDDPGSPVYGSSKGLQGICGIVGGFYKGDAFPEWYHDKLFIGDYDRGWLKVVETDLNDDVLGITDFFTDTIKISHLELNPNDGAVYFIDFPNGIKKITYGQNIKPVAVLEADQYYGPSPLTVQFDASESYDPNDDDITFAWDFGSEMTSSEVAPKITFERSGGVPSSLWAKLTVSDEEGLVGVDSVLISLNNTPPDVSITNIEDGATYAVDGLTFLQMEAAVDDKEHALSSLKYEWQLFLGHNTHEHPEPVITEVNPQIRILPTSCGVEEFYYRIELRVTDPEGLSAVDSKRLLPDCDGAFVELLVLTTDQMNDAVSLSWTTGFEKELSKIFVEKALGRSEDYEVIGEVEGTNQGMARWDYTFNDHNIENGNVRYRLRFVSSRGQEVYSQSMDVSFVHPETINIHPNPTSERLRVQFGALKGDGNIVIFDVNGRRILEQTFDMNGSLNPDINVRSLESGTYYYQLFNGEITKNGSLLIIR